MATSADGDADLQMALAVSASLRDEQERSRRLAEVQLLDLGLEGELEAARDSGGAQLPPEPAVPAPVNGQLESGDGGDRRPVPSVAGDLVDYRLKAAPVIDSTSKRFV